MLKQEIIRLEKLTRFINHSDEKTMRMLSLVEKDPTKVTQVIAYLEARLRKLDVDPGSLPVFAIANLEQQINGISVGNQIIDKIPISPYDLSLEQLATGHTLVLGSTNSGKSSLLKNIFWRLIKPQNQCTVWCFDFLNEYRELLRVSPDILVINWKQFRWNVLKAPKNVEQAEWNQSLTEVYSHSFKVLTGSKSFVYTTLCDLMELFNKNGIFPTAQDYVEYLQNLKLKKTHYSYLPVNLIRFESICRSLGKMINVQKGFLDELIDSGHHVIFELSGIAEAELQNFIVELLMTALFLARRK